MTTSSPFNLNRRQTLASIRRVGVVAALGLMLSACNQILPPLDLKAPSISVAGVGFESVSREQLRLRVTLATRNPNPVELPLSDLKFDVSLFGQRIAQGQGAEQRITLPAGSDQQVPIILTLSAADLRALMPRALMGSDAQWELKGSARWGISPIPLPIEHRGSLSLKTLRDLVLR